MTVKKAPKKKPKAQKIQITELDGTTKLVGKYNSEERLFTCDRKKSEHFMVKYNSWGLDSKVVEFLVKERAIIKLKDKDSKWEYTCEAIDFVINGKIEEFKQHRPQYFLPLQYWEIATIKNRSMIVECLEVDCKYNFGSQCLRGVIRIGKEGECSSYEDKN